MWGLAEDKPEEESEAVTLRPEEIYSSGTPRSWAVSSLSAWLEPGSPVV